MSTGNALITPISRTDSKRRSDDTGARRQRTIRAITTAAGRRPRPPRRDTVNGQADHPLRATLVSRDDVRRHLVVQVDPDHAQVRIELVAPGVADGATGSGGCAVSRPSRTSITAVARIDLAHDPHEDHPELDVTLAVTWSRRLNGSDASTDISGTALLFSNDGRAPEEFRALNADLDTAREPDTVVVAPNTAPGVVDSPRRGHGRLRLPLPGRTRPGRAPRTEPGTRWNPGYATAPCG